jgi:hypothetical protein
MSGGAWGLGTWGLGPWGGLAGLGGGILSFVSAYATSTNTVLVQLAAPPLAQSAVGVGDALNPVTWSVVQDDTGFVFTVIAVLEVAPDMFELRTLEKLGSWLSTHTVSSTTLVDGGGNPIVPPTAANFAGVQASVQPFSDAGVTDFDIANPQVPNTGTPANIPTTAAGDFDEEAGAALAEKLIIRAITTSTGSFFHLPKYGFGFAKGQNVTSSNLPTIKAQILLLVQAIPVVSSAVVGLNFDNTSGILTVTVTAVLRNTGNTIQVINHTNLRGNVTGV